MNPESVTRIAFISQGAHEYAGRLARGVCKFATPEKGFITRDFVIGNLSSELPLALEAWVPEAIVSFVAGEDLQILSKFARQGTPIANVARATPSANRAVVIGDAEEVYEAVHQHFEPLELSSVWLFTMGEEDTPHSSQHQYRRYAEQRGRTCLTYSAPDYHDLDSIERMSQVDIELRDWLYSLPKPAGIFSQQTYAGQYLSRACKLLEIRVPEDVAIIGSDGFDLATASSPPVTSIRAPAEKVGYRAAEVVASMLDGTPAPDKIERVAGARRVVRQSTRTSQLSGCDIDAAMQFIEQHACDGVKVSDVIEHTQGVSRVTFHKKFLEITGATPAQTLLDRKLTEARRLLAASAISAGSIAGMCGYQDYIHFYRTFKKAEGVSPTEYRELTNWTA